MIHSLAVFIANRLFDEKDKYPMDIYVYGIELVISSVITNSLIILIGLITHSFIECIIYQVSFSLIRIYTGGYHSMTYLRCNIISVLSYCAVFLSLHFLGNLFANPFVMAGGYLITIGLAIAFAPVRHPNKKLTASEEKKYKLLSIVVITIIYLICSLMYYLLGVTQTLIIFPTCITIDIAMMVSIFKNFYILRRNNK